MTNGFTRTQAAMLEVLADGQMHVRDELHACLYDTLGQVSNIQAHLTHIRKKIRPSGMTITCTLLDGKWYYQKVRLLASPNDGRR